MRNKNFKKKARKSWKKSGKVNSCLPHLLNSVHYMVLTLFCSWEWEILNTFFCDADSLNSVILDIKRQVTSEREAMQWIDFIPCYWYQGVFGIENIWIILRSFSVLELETWTLLLINNLYLYIFLLFLSSYYFDNHSQHKEINTILSNTFQIHTYAF